MFTSFNHFQKYAGYYLLSLVLVAIVVVAAYISRPTGLEPTLANGGSDDDNDNVCLYGEEDVICDGFESFNDNCSDVFNPGQHDYNGNEIGDACELSVVYKYDEFEFCEADEFGERTDTCETIMLSGTAVMRGISMDDPDVVSTEMVSMNLTGTSDLLGGTVTMTLDSPVSGYYQRMFDDFEFPATAQFQNMVVRLDTGDYGLLTLYPEVLAKTESGIITAFPPMFGNPMCDLESEYPLYRDLDEDIVGFIVKNCDEFSLWPSEHDFSFPADASDSENTEIDMHLIQAERGQSDEVKAEGQSVIQHTEGEGVLDTEILSMNLTGNSNEFGPITIGLQAEQQSLGQIESILTAPQTFYDPIDPPDFPAESFFDVFLKIKLQEQGLSLVPMDEVGPEFFEPVPVRIYADPAIKEIPSYYSALCTDENENHDLYYYDLQEGEFVFWGNIGTLCLEVVPEEVCDSVDNDNDGEIDEGFDEDGDGISDCADNCEASYNPDQLDADEDGVGDECENCVETTNPDQGDEDMDGVGDACDLCSGSDDDVDADEDGVPDACDSCPPNSVYGSTGESEGECDEGDDDVCVVLTDEGGFEWDPYDPGGYLDDGSDDAYDGMYYLSIDIGEEYRDYDGNFSNFEEDGRELVFNTQEMENGLEVYRKFMVPTAVTSFGRYLEFISNPTEEAITIAIRIYGDLGSDSDTEIIETSDGDTDVEKSDFWVVTDDGDDGSDDPSLAHVWDGPGVVDHIDDVFFENEDDQSYYEWRDITIQPGETVLYMHFPVQKENNQAAIDEANDLWSSPNLEGMTLEEIDLVRNWSLTLVEDIGDPFNPRQYDSDGDGVGDTCDLCPGDADNNDCIFDSIKVAAIDPLGGINITIDGRVSVEIPPGALDEMIETTISRDTVPTNFVLSSSGGSQTIFASYTFTPTPFTFSLPVTITINYDDSDVPAGQPEPTGILDMTVDPAQLIGSCDNVANTCTAQTDHFSNFGLGAATIAAPTATTGGDTLFLRKGKVAEKVEEVEGAEGTEEAEEGLKPAAEECQFADIEGHWSKKYIIELCAKGAVHGKTPTVFDPNGNISRAELAKMAVNAFGVAKEDIKGSYFRDVALDAWYAPFIEAAHKAGVVDGYLKRLFIPNRSATRAEALKMILEAAEVELGKTGSLFTDVSADDWFAKYVSFAKENSIIEGYDDGRFWPNNKVTRGQASKMVWKILAKQ